MDLIGVSDHQSDPSDPNRPNADPMQTQTDSNSSASSDLRKLDDSLARWLVGFAWVRGVKKGPYSHEPGTFEFYE